MDERLVYPGQSDLEGAITAAKARYWENHARQLEAQYAQVVVNAGGEQEPEGDANEMDSEFLGLLVPSPDLAAIVGAEPLGRTEATKKVWAYIKKNKLQDSINKRMINADSKFRKLFNKPQVSMFELTNILNQNLKQMEPSSGLPDGVTKLNPAAAWPFPTKDRSVAKPERRVAIEPELNSSAELGPAPEPPIQEGGFELPRILTAGAVSVAANAVLGVEDSWMRIGVTVVCFLVVGGLWSLLQSNGKPDL
ncbi:SWIB/MDM2 domain-containing protein [Rhodoferax sp.]|uniref:SWIB/MDM2 domain-containing protein n=1 Tax=Rhodoferax sp. TaxID=50421 RepID=UPI003783FB9B